MCIRDRSYAACDTSYQMSETANQGRVGVFGIGLAAYWEQFPGLKPRLEGYQRFVESQAAGFGVEVISAGLVDTATSAPTPHRRRCRPWCSAPTFPCSC